VHEPRTKVDLTRFTECHAFRFDDVFDQSVDNDALYARAIKPLIATVFRAGKGTCFAYGQTGSGKTYTMQPLPLRAAADIFAVVEALPQFAAHSLHVACYEIYGGKVFDLLNGRQRLEVREDAARKVQVVGLKEVEVRGVDLLQRLCEHAAASRSTGSTGANDESSRSHSIMTFALRAPPPPAAAGGGGAGRPGRAGAPVSAAPPLRTVGKLSFIDLAGSERGADTTDNDKQTRLEGAEINKSLLALKECIRALDAQARHIPFRGSKLTEVLRDSFVGKNARTVMIANVSPNAASCEHTLNTLRYADRVKEMKKDGGGPGGGGGRGSFANGGAAANGGGGGGGGGAAQAGSQVSEGAREVAALLHRLPPPSAAAAAAAGEVMQPKAKPQALPLAPPSPPHQPPPQQEEARGSSRPPPAPAAAAGSRSPRRWESPRRAPPAAARGSPRPLAPQQQQAQQQQQQAQQQAQDQWQRAGSLTGGLTAHPLQPSLSDASGTTSGGAPSGSLGTPRHSYGAQQAAQPQLPQPQPQAAPRGPAPPPPPDDALEALLAAEEELIGAHRAHIENTMAGELLHIHHFRKKKKLGAALLRLAGELRLRLHSGALPPPACPAPLAAPSVRTTPLALPLPLLLPPTRPLLLSPRLSF
jgi:kinesin family protein 2/24